MAPSGEWHYSIEWLVWEWESGATIELIKKGATGSDGGRATPITWYSTPTDVPKFPPPPEAESLLAFRRPSEAAAKF